MSDPILNYVRCPYCGGNAAVSHPCDVDAQQKAADESFARFMGAVNADPAEATADQLRVKLGECEEAFYTLRDTVREQDEHLAALAALSEAGMIVDPDREPLPSDGPDYHADHDAWVQRQSRSYWKKLAGQHLAERDVLAARLEAARQKAQEYVIARDAAHRALAEQDPATVTRFTEASEIEAALLAALLAPVEPLPEPEQT